MKPFPRRPRNDPNSPARLQVIDHQNLSLSVAHLSADTLQSSVALATKLIDFAIQASDQVHRFVNRSSEFVPLALPPIDTFDFGCPAPHLGVNLLTQLALGPGRNCLHDELHATSFTNPVFLGAVLAEMAPLPVAAHEPVLIEEAHVSRAGNYRSCTPLDRTTAAVIGPLI